MYVCKYIYAYEYVYICIHMCMYIYICGVKECGTFVQLLLQGENLADIYIHTYIYIPIYTYVYIYKCTHIYIYIYKTYISNVVPEVQTWFRIEALAFFLLVAQLCCERTVLRLARFNLF